MIYFGMAKKSFIQQAKEGVDKGIAYLFFDRYKLATQCFKQVIEISKPLYERGCFSGSRPYSCYIISSAFGLGFTEGLIEYQSSPNQTLDYFLNASHILCESAKAFHDSNAKDLEQEIHTKIGKGYGLLGLKKEGLKILDNSREMHIFGCYGYE